MECKAHFHAHLSFWHILRGAVTTLQGFCINANMMEPRLIACVYVYVCVCVGCICVCVVWHF